MKKYLWIVALLTALTLAFIGCPEGGTTTTPVDPGGKQPVISLNPFNITMGDNFEYGEGYQGLIDNLTLFPGGKITEGDVYTLKMTFTTTRDVEDSITVGLVDRTDPNGGGDYWIPLSYDADDDGWDYEDEDAPAVLATVEDVADGAEVTVTVTMTALHTALTAQANANSIAFETQGQGTPGTANSGQKGPFQIRVTEFLFVKGTAEDLEGGEIEPPPEAYVPAPVVEDEDYTVKLEGLTMKNETATSGNYDNLWFNLSEAFPEDFDIMNYNAFTVKAKFYDEDGEEITLANGLGQMRFALGNAFSGGSWISISNLPNLGTSATEEVGIYDNELLVTPTMLYVQNAQATVKFIEITEITFHWGTERLVSVSAPEPLPEVGIEGFTKVDELTLDITNFNNTKWSWTATDQGEGYLKGRINATTATAIKALTGGKYQIYWVSSTGLAINDGIGSFGEQGYNSVIPADPDSPGVTRGIVVGDITPLSLETGGNAGQLNLNTYNNGGVVKILFYSSDAPVADIPVTERAIGGITAPASGQTPAAAVTATTQFTGTVAWTYEDDDTDKALEGDFADGTVYTATITLTAGNGYTFDGVAASAGFTVAGATTVTNTAGSGKTIVVTAVFPPTEAPATALTVTVDGTAKQTTSLTGWNAIVTLLNDGSGVEFDIDTEADDKEYDHSYFVFKLDLGEALTGFSKINFTVTGTQYKEVWVRAGSADITGYMGATAEAVLFTASGNTLTNDPSLELAIDSDEAEKVTVTDLYFAIDVRIGASDGPITITDITFVKGE